MKRFFFSLCKTCAKPLQKFFSKHQKQENDFCEEINQEHIIESFFQLPVSEIMIPRSDIASVPSHAAFHEVIQTFLKTGFQWLPVYRGTLDTITGIISAHSVMALRESDQEEGKWYRHMNTPMFCPSSMSIREAIRLMHNPHKAPMIFVVDEYGGIEGVITKWQVMKEVFQLCGEDWLEEEQMVLSRDPVPLVSGRIDLESFSWEFNCPDLFDEEDQERIHTLGGWLCAHVGRVPLTGEVISHPSGFIFEIRQATPRKIHHIAIIGQPPAPLSPEREDELAS